MLDNFNVNFQDFLYKRCGKISDSLLFHNNEYIQLQEKQRVIFNELDSSLTKEQKALFFKYEETETQLTCIHIDTVYKEGLKDGCKLKTFLSSKE